MKCDTEDTEAFKDVDLMLFDKVIAFDHVRQKLILIVNMPLEDPETGYHKAVMDLEQNGRASQERGKEKGAGRKIAWRGHAAL